MEHWIVVLLRTVILFFITLGLIRLIGRSSLSKATPFKFVSYTVIAIMVALIALGIISNTLLGLLSLGIWFLFSFGLDYLSLKSKKVHDFINGREVVLIKDGKVMEENLMKVRYSGEELLRELRSKNAFQPADVEFALMEATGEINVLLKSDKKPVTSHDLGIKIAPSSEPQTVILDGNILDEPLANMGSNRGWLKVQLSSMGVSLDNVFIGQLDSSGDLFVDLFDDSIKVSQPKVKELLYASMQKVHADFLSYTLDTENPKAKKMYADNAKIFREVIEKIEPYLLK